MSASPAGPPSGPPSTTPNGGPAAGPPRRRKVVGAFAQKPKPAARRPPPSQSGPSTATHNIPSAARTAPPASSHTPGSAQVADPDDDPSLYSEYPLVTTKKALLEGLRHHVMRFTSDKEVNPYDSTQDQFQRPVRLQRRFPHDTPKTPVPVTADNADDDKEREKEAIRKAEKVAEREANQAQIAPTDKTAAAKKREPFKKKTEDVYFPTDTPEAQKRAKLRYEEGRPWHLEDFTGKNSWVGTYEEPLSEAHAMFVLESNGQFRMVPLEKWYRFAPTARYTTMNLDEAEMHMSKKMKQPRFYGEAAGRVEEKRKAEDEVRRRLQERGRVGMRGEDKVIKDEDQKVDFANDVDEIDFEGAEEFQDDDEDKLFGEDEEAKDAERKIKEERHEANIFAGTGVKDDRDWDEEEAKEKKRQQDERKLAKKLRKNLIKREKKYEYDSESDHPYSDEVCISDRRHHYNYFSLLIPQQSDSEDSDDERIRLEEERKKEEEAKANGDKLASGASSKGTNTPSGRPEKQQAEHLRNKSSIANLKRPGSPNLSEASGSESTHKRVKKDHGQRSGHMTPSGSLSRKSSSLLLLLSLFLAA